MEEKEIWKSIKDFPDYEISNMGQVRSLRGKSPLIMKPCDNGHGYKIITFTYRIGKIKKKSFHRYIHRLVAETFIGRCPAKMEVSHIDETRTNNCISNLCYETRSENRRRPLCRMRTSNAHPLSKTGYRGVSRQSNGYQASLGDMGKLIYLGYFPTAREAALAFDTMAIKLRGNYAITNKKLGLL